MAVAAMDIGAEGMNGFDLSPSPRFNPMPRRLGLNSIGVVP